MTTWSLAQYTSWMIEKPILGEPFEVWVRPDAVVPLLYYKDAARAALDLAAAPSDCVKAINYLVDGVGIAPHGESNPFTNLETPALDGLGISRPTYTFEPEFVARPIDARLGVDGLPQSGTGQTTLLTGRNAAKHLGYHHGPWPGPTLKPLIEESILVRLARAGKTVRLANLYPPRYLEAIQSGKRRLNAIALSATLAGARLEPDGIPPPFGKPDDLQNTPITTVRDWGRTFVTDESDLVIFDSWWSDHVGHAMDMVLARDHVVRLEAFASGVLENRPPDTLFLVTSDHGNFEHQGVKTHTMADVPFAAVGAGVQAFSNVTDLSGVTPALEQVFGIK